MREEIRGTRLGKAETAFGGTGRVRCNPADGSDGWDVATGDRNARKDRHVRHFRNDRNCRREWPTGMEQRKLAKTNIAKANKVKGVKYEPVGIAAAGVAKAMPREVKQLCKLCIAETQKGLASGKSLWEADRNGRAIPPAERERATMSEQMKTAAVAALSKANADYPSVPLGQQIKVAIARFILDEAGVKEPEARQDALDAFMETPSWFGASANAMTESGVIEPRKRGEKTVGGFKAN